LPVHTFFIVKGGATNDQKIMVSDPAFLHRPFYFSHYLDFNVRGKPACLNPGPNNFYRSSRGHFSPDIVTGAWRTVPKQNFDSP